MTLSRLLDGVTVSKLFQTLYGRFVVTHDIQVRQIQYDSRKVERGDVFVAIRGTQSDGHAFIHDAVKAGTVAVVLEDDKLLTDSFFMHAGVVKVVVANSRIALARMASNYFSHPSKQLTLVGVTGTNGKTTTTYLVRSILGNSGLIGTITYDLGKGTIPAHHTTPESLELNAYLATMVENKCTAAVMEVSSHALHQHRVDGLDFDAAVFTNLTQDHLDYHGSMVEYFKAKKILFDNLKPEATAVVNFDDPHGLEIVASCPARRITYGMRKDADVRAENVHLTAEMSACDVVHRGERTRIESPLIGRFNLYNLLAAYATGVALGVSAAQIQAALRHAPSIPGRFERIVAPSGWTAIVDYAHTPDALQNCLRAIHEILTDGETHGAPSRRGRIITVFGCGGNRDKKKRPMMGRIATELSDIVIVTSDNPRYEDPETIIDDIIVGVTPKSRVHREVDRRKAIEAAISIAQAGDVILIAGKGHENYQIVGDERHHFSDREVVEECLRAV